MENPKEFTKVFGKLSADLFRPILTALTLHIAETFELDKQQVLDCVKNLDCKKLVPPKKSKRTQVPGAPDRAKTAYIFFSSEIRQDLKGEDGKQLAFAQAGKVIGQKWHALSDKDKEKYNKKAEEDRRRYEQAMKNFDPKYKPKGTNKKEEKSDLEKHRDGVKAAKEKSSGDVVYCHNLSTSRTIKYQVDKPSSDKIWNVEEHVCANNQADMDTWLPWLTSTKKVGGVKAAKKKTEPEPEQEQEQEEESDFDDEDEEEKPKAPAKKPAAGGKKKK